jgi:hypothetical protein
MKGYTSDANLILYEYFVKSETTDCGFIVTT